jgi:hypothetical protein
MRSVIMRFEETVPYDDDAHKAWRVESLPTRGQATRERLGEVRWYGRDRLYHFHPAPGVSFGPVRLYDLSHFIREKTSEARADDLSKMLEVSYE